MYINKEQKKRIKDLIKEIESNSSVELLSVVSNKIESYSYINSFLSMISKKYNKKLADDYINRYFNNIQKENKDVKDIVLFFVCIEEKYVKILTSHNINKKIDNNFWQKIIDEFIIKVKENKIEDGFINAINSSKDILISEFPHKNNKNELPNEVIEI